MNRHPLLLEVEQLALKNNRQAQDVTVLAVSKTHSCDAIVKAHQQGFTHFGENYLQEALGKIKNLEHLALTWHYIGSIQSNKTKDIASHFDWVHTVSRAKIAQRLNKQRPQDLAALNVCIQVNLAGETSKSGVSIEQLDELVETILALPRLKLRGLMCIPQALEDYAKQCQQFNQLHQCLTDINQRYNMALDTLSMGMSGDYAAAIASGATIIRVGTAIFGARNYDTKT